MKSAFATKTTVARPHCQRSSLLGQQDSRKDFSLPNGDREWRSLETAKRVSFPKASRVLRNDLRLSGRRSASPAFRCCSLHERLFPFSAGGSAAERLQELFAVRTAEAAARIPAWPCGVGR